MGKLNRLFIIVFFISYSHMTSQNSAYKSGVSNLLNAASPEQIGDRTSAQINADSEDPLDYGYVDDNDILWSTTVWEIIDLDERVNFPLLYPTELRSVGNERRPMLWWLRQEIEKGNIPVYDQSETGGYFLDKVEFEDVGEIFRYPVYSFEAEERQNDGENEIIIKIDEQEDFFGFNPYNEGLTNDQMNALDNDPNFIKIFPYKIKDDKLSVLYQDGIINYSDFENYAEGNVTDDDLSISYQLVFAEMVRKLLSVEGVDFEYFEVDYANLKQWLIKGVWYFDKKYSELIYRPIGIAPVISSSEDSFDGGGDDDEDFSEELPTEEDLFGDGIDSDDDGVADYLEEDEYFSDPYNPDTDEDGLNDGDELMRGTYVDDPDSDGDGVSDGDEVASGTDPLIDDTIGDSDSDSDMLVDSDDDSVSSGNGFQVLFWVYYPHAREILKKGHAFNSRNMTQSISFDEIINSRRFNGVIFKEENIYENREVKDYMNSNSFMRLLESERIKEKIRNFEHDMWSW